MLSSEDQSAPKERKGTESWVWRASAAFLALVVVALVFILITGRPEAPASAAPAVTPTTTAAATTTSSSLPSTSQSLTSAEPSTTTSEPAPQTAAAAPVDSTSTSLCGLPDGSQDIPVTPPAATWQFVGSIAAPTNPAYGPGVVVNGVGGCYAHSPTGALFAMVNSIVLTSASSDQIKQVDIVTQRGSKTNLYDVALSEAEQEDAAAEGRMPSEESTTEKRTILGYQFIDYADDRATIAVAIGIGDPASPSYQPSTLTGVVVWEDGDWKFIYSAQTAGSMAPIISDKQYTHWAA